MMYKKEGFPEESEIVICSVLKVHHNTVFCLLDEYDKKGIIHISEISPGRIRNIRDYVVEGKKVICKVLRIDKAKGHIDLSLRRVNEGQRRQKSSQLKQEQKAEKMLELACKEAGADLRKTYKDIMGRISDRYETLYSCFEDVIAGNFSVSELKLDKKMAESLENLIRTRIKPPEVVIRSSMRIESYDPEGIEIIKQALKKGEQENTEIRYSGGGRYSMSVKAEDYKSAESIMKKAADSVREYVESHNSTIEITREES